VFSQRLPWAQIPNRLSQLRAEKRRSGASVLDLTESNPTRAGFVYPDILSALADPRGMRYDPFPQGSVEARRGISGYYADRGVMLDESRIVLTASTSEAYGFLFKLLADPGDRILTPRPSYPLFEHLAALECVHVAQYPLRYAGAWHIDFTALESAATPGTRAIVVVNPNNPTGSFLRAKELARLEEFAAARNLAILSDEVFAGYAHVSDPGAVQTLIGERKALTFSMNGLSKIAGLPQMKLGWIAVSGPGTREALERLELIADTYLSVAAPVQLALPKILPCAGSVQEQVLERTATNLARLRDLLRGSPASVLNVEGGWYAIIQVPRTRAEEEWVLTLLREHDVLVQPGYFFDFESEAYLVVSLLTIPETFAEGVRRMVRSIES
jgi:alanine-synthesizing transaminase